jgi:iron complex transport system ATP-binding protein
MMKKTLTINNASIGYRTGKKTTHVVDGIDASLHCGELVALIGKNGAGKSTLLRTLSAFQKPLTGTIECNGRNMAEMSPNDVAKELAVVLTSAEPAPLTVRELVSLGRTPYTNFLGRMSGNDNGIVNDAMDLMGVRGFENRLSTSLSDGERQKCMIAKALAQETSLILLDEPTAFLDIPTRFEVCRLLADLAHKEGKTILFSTHDVDSALPVCDSFAIIDNGTLKKLPTVEAKAEIEKIFR